MSENNKSNTPSEAVYKKIAIPLCGFKRNHGPFDESSDADEFGDKGSFVGRFQLIDSLGNLLNQTKGKRGTYLIAGYRGSGKSSLINHVINKYNKSKKVDKPPVIKVLLNLGNDSNLTPIRLFYSIANILLDEFREKQGKVGGVHPGLSKKLFIVGMFFLLVGVFALGVKSLDNVPLQLPFCNTLFDLSILLLFMLFFCGWFIVFHFFYKNRTALRVERRLKYLIERIAYETTGQSTLGNRFTPFSFVRGRKSLPVHAREAEEVLVSIIKDISTIHADHSYEVMFVFDEIDKLSRFGDVDVHGGKAEDGSEKIKNINQLLGSIKYFITTCNAKFFIISGRETLDSYYSEKGSVNSLYESLFDGVYEVPSLLTDDGVGTNKTQISTLIEKYLCKAISWHQCDDSEEKNTKYSLKGYFEYLSKESEPKRSASDCRYLVSQLRSFVSYLAFHSWGNPKRLSALFESFVVSNEHIENNRHSYEMFGYETKPSRDWLSISINDKRSFSLASEIFTLFQYHLSREVSKTSDKLTVSALSSLHFILKLHPYGFTRESLHRMSEAINIYRSPELNTIVDDLLSQILKSYIRRVRNGSYRYRFNSGLEQELRYISHVNELESASYNFSLNSMGPVKAVFERNLLENNELDDVTKTKLYMTLGDMCAIEQSYNSAAINYGIARSFIEKVANKKRIACDFNSAMLLCELGVKQGDLEERRQNYNHAASIYSDVGKFVDDQLQLNRELREVVRSGDSKWDMFKQAAWANMFLSLKRSPESSIMKDVSYMYSNEDSRMFSKKATLHLFLGELKEAAECYLKVVDGNGLEEKKWDEKGAYIKGNALIGLADVCLLEKSLDIMKAASVAFLDKDKGGVRLEVLGILKKFVKNPVQDGGSPSNSATFSENIRSAAESFEQSGLYISAALSHIKIIGYWATILDFFVKDELGDDSDLKEKILKIFDDIDHSGKKATECIIFARQLDSSQFTKTFIINDQPCEFDNDCLVSLFDVLLGSGGDGNNCLTESIVWPQSLWAHKLASTLCWANLVRKKLLGKQHSRINAYPTELSSLSVRSAITMRWIISREELNELMLEKYIIHKPNSEQSGGFEPLKYLGLMQEKGAIKLGRLGKKLIDEDFENGVNVELQKAYQVSRNLYFSLQSIRLISRKNLDLVYPNMAQIYFLQWKLLSMLVTIYMIRDYEKNTISSVRSYALEVQRKLIAIDELLAPDERIPPSHFEYEHVFMRAKSHLLDAGNINDPSSRVSSSILQQKHYCHDDHSDPEFRLDWTLAHIFSSSAYYLIENIDNTHNEFIKLTRKQPKSEGSDEEK